MKKLILYSLIIAACAAQAQIKIDTISTMPAGPGTTHFKMYAPTVPWVFNVLKIDLRNPYINMRSVKAQDRLNSFEKVSSMAARYDAPGRRVIGAINGDYWGGTQPIGLQVSNGEVVKRTTSFMVLAFDTANRPSLFRPALWNGSVTARGNIRSISGVNESRGTDQIILYNSYFGASTGTNQYGSEASLTPLNEWIVNDTTYCIVDTVVNNVGAMSISAGKAVLSGHGANQSFVSALAKGDTVKIFNRISNMVPYLKEAIGGHPRIVVNGQNYVNQGVAEEGGPSHWITREPRTCVGLTADSSTLYLIVVDGRTSASAGMTFQEMADFMLRLGIHTGGVLDGGGSSTIVVRGKIENVPSDGPGTERSVSNGLMVLSSAPTGSVSSLVMTPQKRTVFLTDTVQFTITGVDEYNNPISVDQNLVQYTVSPSLGSMLPTGRFAPSGSLDSGWVYADYSGIRDSAYVVLRTYARIAASPRNVVTDTVRTVPITVRAFDQDDVLRTYQTANLSYVVLNPSIGSVVNHAFKGASEGSTRIVIALNGTLRDTIDIAVDIGTETALVSAMDSITGWSISSQNLNSVALEVRSAEKTYGTAAVSVSYSGIINAALPKYMYVDLDLPVPAVPDTVLLDVKPDSSSYRFFYIVEDDNGELFRWSQTSLANWYNTFRTMKIATSPAQQVTTGGIFNYPVRMKRIEIQLFSTRSEGTVLIDNLRVRYPATTTNVEAGPAAPRGFTLEQNYPNPFNPSTVILYSVPSSAEATITVYDMLGREVTVLFKGTAQGGAHIVRWDASAMPSGVYFVRLQAGNTRLTRKMVLMK